MHFFPLVTIEQYGGSKVAFGGAVRIAERAHVALALQVAAARHHRPPPLTVAARRPPPRLQPAAEQQLRRNEQPLPVALRDSHTDRLAEETATASSATPCTRAPGARRSGPRGAFHALQNEASSNHKLPRDVINTQIAKLNF